MQASKVKTWTPTETTLTISNRDFSTSEASRANRRTTLIRDQRAWWRRWRLLAAWAKTIVKKQRSRLIVISSPSHVSQCHQCALQLPMTSKHVQSFWHQTQGSHKTSFSKRRQDQPATTIRVEKTEIFENKQTRYPLKHRQSSKASVHCAPVMETMVQKAVLYSEIPNKI